MTAAWHVGPIEGAQFWWLLVSSPEILVFLFFMITDPKTTPASNTGRRAYAIGVGLLATLLIAPQTTEFATKVAILASLAIVCATRGLVELVGAARLARARAPAVLRPATTRRSRRGARRRSRVRRARVRSRDTGAARTREEATTAGGPLPGDRRRGREGRRPDRRLRRAGHRAGRPRATSALESDALRQRGSRRRRSGGQRSVARVAVGPDPGSWGGDHGRPLRRRPDGADTASRRVPGPAQRRRQPPGNVRRVDVRPNIRCARRPARSRAVPANRGAPAERRDVPDRPLRGRPRAGDVLRPDRRAARSAVRPSSTSPARSGSTSARRLSASASRTTRRR